MRNLILKAGILFSILFLSNNFADAANEYFRSIASGNWNALSTWQMSTNSGGTWIAATSTPTETSGAITIQNTNTVTVTVNVSADQLTVNAGGILSVNSGITFTLKDGAGEDLQLNPGGTVSGTGTFQTQGADVSINIRSTGIFSVALKVNTGKTTSYDEGSPYKAVYSGAITIDAGAVLNVRAGGYSVQSLGSLTNNGDITSGNSSGTFIMSGSSLVNNDSIRAGNLNFDDTTALSGTGAYNPSDISITNTGRVSLSNNLTFSPTSTFTINNGGVLNPNTRTLTINSGTFYLLNGGTILNSGIFQTQSTVSLRIRQGSNFNAPLKVNTGTTTSNDDSPPYIANFYGTITVDAGAVLTTQSGGYSNRSYGNTINNGTITGNNFIMRGASLTNNGAITSTNFQFDSVTSVTSTGSYTSSTITIGATGNVTLITNVTFSPGSNFTINNGGIFNPGSKTFTFSSGAFILNTGAVVSGVGVNAGTMQSQNNVVFMFRNGSTFNSAIKVNTGTLTAYNDQSPYYAVFSGTITVDAGAVLTQANGGYTTQAMNTVINNGTITSPLGGANFRMRGASFVNNSSVSCQTLTFDSTTSLSGTGAYTCQSIVINSPGNVSLANNITFSPSSGFTVNSGGILNPNTRTLTFNSGTFNTATGGTVSNSGLFQTQSSVTIINNNNSSFNAPFKVNTGTALIYNNQSPYYCVFNGPFSVDAGSSVTLANGGYTLQANNTVTLNGTVSGFSSFRMKGNSFVNNSSISNISLDFDSTTTVSGAGTFTNQNISIGSLGNVSLGSNLTIAPTSSFSVNSGGTLNPNSFVFTTTATNYFYSGSTVSNSGTFRTQGSTNLVSKAGCSFNAPLIVNTGTTYIYDNNSPYVGAVNGTITVDAGATLSSPNGSYTLRANNNVTNNGTISASSAPAFRMYGANFVNNGTVSFNEFYFESGSHTLSGTGSWSTNANVLNGAIVTLSSNHQMSSVTVNAGGTFNISTFNLLLKASNPIGNSGTFNTSSGAVEYNGTASQNISTSNITYNKLRINNSAGTFLSGAVTINDTLSVLLGDLNLNGQIITLSPTNGYLNETAGNTVYGASGYITTTRNLNAPSSLNVAGLGAILTTSVNLGSTEIRRGHTIQSGLSGATSISRYFDIAPTTNTGLNATLVFKFDESELNGKIESALSLYRSTNSGSTWTPRGGTVNTAANTITLGSIDAYSRWSASSPTAVASQLKIIIEGFYNVSTTHLNIRDTVRAYLRNNTSPFAVVDSAKSVIDSVNYTGSYLFANAPSGTYYIQLIHRNALETWSKSGGQSFTLGSPFNYDFTDSITKAFGNNMIQKSTKFCIYSGDMLQDGFIDGSDGIVVDNSSADFETGYVIADLNGDRFVDGSDALIVDNNAANFVSMARP
ncbi:MAG: hypothetical protein HGGPFJEG_02848 [Ignavibacteria bacterium]|nr:hypothetical protein [Ignavibacteria bacterium]